MTRVLFMGSPDFALPTLKMLAENFEVVGVVTQPDRPAGRGRVLTPPPVKVLALSLGLPVLQPNRLKEPGVFDQLQAWKPDVMVVAAFGQILRQNVLDLPSAGCINVHGSLLPRWRGAAPIQAMIAAGDSHAGVTIMKMDAGIDTGDMLAQRATPISPQDTGGTLLERLAPMGAELLLETLPAFLRGGITPQPQDTTLATYAPMLKKEDGALDFNRPALELALKVRAFNPWPGMSMIWQAETLKVHFAHAAAGRAALPGERGAIDGFPAVATSQGWLVFDLLQPAGKKPMSGDVFLRGARGWLEE